MQKKTDNLINNTHTCQQIRLIGVARCFPLKYTLAMYSNRSATTPG